MDFRLTQEQDLLRDSARRYFSAASDDHWRHFADSGWLAMLVPEAHGGLGSPLEDVAILCEEMGRGLSPSAFIGGAILPARVLSRCPSSPEQAAIWSSIAEGSLRLAVAVHEPNRRYELLPRTKAVATADGSWLLSGEKSLVVGGANADRLIVSAVIDDYRADPSRPALFVVDTQASGVSRRVFETIDSVKAADFRFEQAAVSATQLIAAPDRAPEILQAALDEASVCLCADILGGMDRAIELTAAHLKMRRQFGQALADFQALQHTVAEMWIDANSARSILYRAIAALGASPIERGRAVSACCVKLMQTAKQVTGLAIHLHGGIGVSTEVPVGHYLRRVLVAERLFGDREHHLQRYLGTGGPS